MLTFFGVGKVKKDKFAVLEEGIRPFLKEVEKEEGILEFKFFKNKEDPAWFLAYEIYQDEEAFEKHRKTQHVDDFYDVLMECAEQDTVRGFWEEIGSIKR